MGISQTVLNLHEKGFNLIPLQKYSKEPLKGFSWKKYQYLKQTLFDIESLFDDHDGNVGIICGEVSGNLSVLDTDDEDTFYELWGIFKEKGLKIVKSPRGGHFYFKTKQPVKSRVFHTKFGKVELRSTGLYVVAQDSYKNEKVRYKVFQEVVDLPVLPLGTIEGLEDIILELDTNSNEIEDILNETGLLKKLREGYYSTRSEADMALITFLVRKGYSSEDVISNFIAKARYSSKYIELSANSTVRANKWLTISIENAMGLGNTAYYNESKIIAEQLKKLLLSSPIIGRSGAGLYKVILTHLECFESASKDTYHLSIRTGIEKTGLSHVTFMKHNKSLLERGIVSLTDRNDEFESNRYRLNTDELTAYLMSLPTQEFTNQSQYTNTDCESFGYLGLFEKGSFGHSSAQIYNLIKSSSGLRVPEIVQITGRSLNTVRRVLKKLTDEGLLLREGNTYTVAEVDLANYAVQNEFIDKATKRKYTHLRERVAYRQSAGNK